MKSLVYHGVYPEGETLNSLSRKVIWLDCLVGIPLLENELGGTGYIVWGVG